MRKKSVDGRRSDMRNLFVLRALEVRLEPILRTEFLPIAAVFCLARLCILVGVPDTTNECDSESFFGSKDAALSSRVVEILDHLHEPRCASLRDLIRHRLGKGRSALIEVCWNWELEFAFKQIGLLSK